MDTKGTLIFFCGKMGAGKTTKSLQLSQELNAVLISEDDWLASLYPNEIKDFNEYLHFSMRLKPLVKAHVQNILKTGVSVILDFPGNTRIQRAWFIEVCSQVNAPHKLFYLKASDEKCLKHLSQRRVTHPERAVFDTEEVFHQVSSYFQAPEEDEGVDIHVLEENA
jgi:predicted kinase